jgi:hypothetical protein
MIDYIFHTRTFRVLRYLLPPNVSHRGIPYGVLFYDRSLSATEMQAVSTALVAKWS